MTETTIKFDIKNWITKHKSEVLARNVISMVIGRGLCLLIQAAYFVILTRSLGARQYGAFIASIAFAQIVSPFVGFGWSNLLIKHVSRDRAAFGECWGNLLVTTLASGLVATGSVIAVTRMVLPSSVPLLVIVFVSIAELLFSRLSDGAAMAFQAVERLDIMAQVVVYDPLLRLLGIAALALSFHAPKATQWALVYCLTTIVSAALGLVWVQLRIGSPRPALNAIRKEFAEGMSFAVSLSAQSIYNDLDKTMLARMSTLDAVGVYAAAYRLIDVAFTPVRALLNATYPGFFRAGQEGMYGAIGYLRRFLPKATGYTLLAFFCLVVGAPLVPRVFGPDFTRSIEALRLLALLPLLKTVHYLLADTLTSTGHQRLRALIQMVVAGFNVLLNLWVIPAYSWRGAAWSSLASDGLLALSMYVALRQLDAFRYRSQLMTREAPRGEQQPINSRREQTDPARRRVVIVNADDFGASLQTNQAIIRAFGEGLISSATIMANMPAFEDACQLVRQHHLELSIGLHINLTLGKPLTSEIADCPGMCQADGSFRPLRRILRLTAKESAAVGREITAQVLACERQGITPTHLDSHNHIHTQVGIAPVVMRVARRSGINVIRLGRNCGPFRDGASPIYSILARAYRNVRNTYLRFQGFGLTRYFGDVRDVSAVLRTTSADVEVMVHPRLDRFGRLVDLDGEDLALRINALNISHEDMCSFAGVARSFAKRDLVPIVSSE